MTYKNSQMAREARILKRVSLVVALFALAVAGMTLALAPREARPEALLVAAGTLGIAIFMWSYAARPDIFSNDPRGVLGDELRTSYHRPERAALANCATAAPPAAGRRRIPVSEHIYAWQDVRRVQPGERIWTAGYVRLVAAQALAMIAGVTLFAALTDGVTLGLGMSAGPMWFVAAAIILPLGFALSHRSGLVDATEYTTTAMPAMPDLAWRPVAIAPPTLSEEPPAVVGPHAA